MRALRAVIISAALALASPAIAQQTPLQGGPWIAGHVPMYSNPGFSQPILQDGGGAGGSGPNGAGVGATLSEIGITARDPNNIYPSVNSGSGPGGTHFCVYDAPITNASGYHYLCLDANAGGGGLIDYGSGGVALPLPLQFSVNGVVFSAGGSNGGLVPGVTSIKPSTNDGVLWDNNGVLGDSRVLPAGLTTADMLFLNGAPGSINIPTPPTGVYIGGGPVFGTCPYGVGLGSACGAPTSISYASLYVSGPSQLDAVHQEYMVENDFFFNTGSAPQWAPSTQYGPTATLGPCVDTTLSGTSQVGQIYCTTANGTSASSGSGPNVTSGTQADGSIVWTWEGGDYGNSKVGSYFGVLVGPNAASRVWNSASDFIIEAGWTGIEAWNHEFDVENSAVNTSIISPYATGRYVQNIVLGGTVGTLPITCDLCIYHGPSGVTATVPASQLQRGVSYTILTVGTTNWAAVGGSGSPAIGQIFVASASNTGTGNGTATNTYASQYAISITTTYQAGVADLYDGTWSPNAFEIQGEHGNAGIYEDSDSGIGLELSGVYANQALTILSISSPIAIEVAGAHATTSYFDEATSPIGMTLGGTNSSEALLFQAATPIDILIGGSVSGAGIQITSSGDTALNIGGTFSEGAIQDGSSATTAFFVSGAYSVAAIDITSSSATAINVATGAVALGGSLTLSGLASGTATKYLCLTSGNVVIAQSGAC